jgi:glutamyl/glutaminyl-tRNA synthetase
LKNEVDELKGTMRAKTHYEVIENLIKERKAYHEYRQNQQEKWRAEQERQGAEMLQAGRDLKGMFDALKGQLGLKNDASLLEFLIHHYEHTPTLDKSTFQLYQKLK